MRIGKWIILKAAAYDRENEEAEAAFCGQTVRLRSAEQERDAAGVVLQERLAEITAERDAANKQIGLLLHNSVELTMLWAAVREAQKEKQVRTIYERLMAKPKEKIKVPLKEKR